MWGGAYSISNHGEANNERRGEQTNERHLFVSDSAICWRAAAAAAAAAGGGCGGGCGIAGAKVVGLTTKKAKA